MIKRYLLGALLAAAPLGAQTVTKDAPARSDEERAVLAVVNKLFDAMRAGDSAAVRAIVHPSAKLFRFGRRDGTLVFTADSIDAFVRAIGRPHAEVWDERTANERVFIDGPMAMVWLDYVFYLGTKFSHCGADAFQLFRSAEGWKIATISDTQRPDGCAPAFGRRP